VRGSRARVNPCNTRGGKLRRKTSKSRRKMSLQNCQILENLSENIKIFPSEILFSSTAFRLSSTAFRFLQRLSAFFNGFLLSSMAFCFPQWLSAFLNGFPLFSMAFRFPQQLSAFLNGFLLEGGFSFPFLFLSQMPLGLVNVVGCGPTKPFEVSEGNHDAQQPSLNSRQRSRC
jgi:hypothetical protein